MSSHQRFDHGPRSAREHVPQEAVRLRAYEIYESRRREGVEGDPATDWLRAEQELGRERPQG